MRYFASEADLSQLLREQVMLLLGQPNGMAAEPWPINGDFTANGITFIALGPHHTQGEFWQAVIAEAVSLGVVEITEAEYLAARPIVQP